MPLAKKTLWFVDVNSWGACVHAAVKIAATDVAIRTTTNLQLGINRFHDAGLRVHGWRWPSAERSAAIAEANAAAKLFDAGMDGYIVDPEGEPGASYDWNRAGLQQLAKDFCAIVATGAGGRSFGVTSHYRAKAVFPDLPWSAFFEHATILLPQAYWRADGGRVGSGNPTQNFTDAVNAWLACGANSRLLAPMAGELAHITVPELDSYLHAASNGPLSHGHFYAYQKDIDVQLLSSIAAA